jgi:hypothetical protein
MRQKLIPFVSIVLASIFQFNSCLFNKADLSNPKSSSFNQSQSPISLCGLEGFTDAPGGHQLEEIEQPFIVSKVKGLIKSAVGDWPEGARILFELRSKEAGSITRRVETNKFGEFIIDGISEGQYCFKATIYGWQSVMGIIIVSKKADSKGEIRFSMRLEV